jgi:hypothetical protein
VNAVEDESKHMKVKTFDKLSAILIILSCAYTVVVAVARWDWFPNKNDWGRIANIPPTMIDYIALLLPWTLLLIYLLTRRLYFKQPFK